MAKIAKVLMSRSRSEKDEVRRQAGISIIGALGRLFTITTTVPEIPILPTVKAENAETGYSLSEEEVIAQVGNTVILLNK
jgi:hypothetical protein